MKETTRQLFERAVDTIEAADILLNTKYGALPVVAGTRVVGILTDNDLIRALVDALAREGLPRRAEATRAVEAVVCALSQRISGPDFEQLRDLLPDPFRSRLVTCERHAATPHAMLESAEEKQARP